MHYAPILIPTLCRYEHFVRCIESLKRNTWAKYTDVYVALDYPSKESHWAGYNKICKYLDNKFDEFANFYVIKRPYNYGSGKNMDDLRSAIFKKYDRFIRTDDDCEFAPGFLEYMNLCLEKYKNDESVVGVTGFSYPVDWEINPECNAFKNTAICPMWGTGFMTDKFLKMKKEIEFGIIREQFLAGNVHRKGMTDARYLDAISGALSDNENNLVSCFSDVAMGCYIQLLHKYVITPKESLVRNYGFDGTGEYCQDTSTERNNNSDARTYNYASQSINMDEKNEWKVDGQCDFQRNIDILNGFDRRNSSDFIKTIIKSKIKQMIFKLRLKKKEVKNNM